MESVFYLIIAALVSLHQYLPSDGSAKKYFEDVHSVNLQNALPAANQTCLYLYDLSKEAGLEKLQDKGPLGFLAGKILNGSNGLPLLLSFIEKEPLASRLRQSQIEPSALKTFLSNLCSQEFNDQTFSPMFKKNALAFIKSEVGVLKEEQLKSLGALQNLATYKIFDQSQRELPLPPSMQRQWVPYAQISKTLVLSLLVTEDDQFFAHNGVSLRSVGRIVKESMSEENPTGGSTITMQVLKNLFFAENITSQRAELKSGVMRNLLRKVREWYWAKPFETQFARNGEVFAHKEKVLEIYFNLVNFGYGIQGLHQAAEFYFNKTAGELSAAEAAYLTTLLKRPAYYADPLNYEGYTKPRRDNYVIQRMAELCQTKINESPNLEITLMLIDLCSQSGLDGITPQKIEILKKTPLPQWKLQASEAVQLNIEKSLQDLTVDSLVPFSLQAQKETQNFVEGQVGFYPQLQVHTTLNPDLQAILAQVVRQKINDYDSARNGRQGYMHAMDDRGRKAQVITEDLGFTFLANIRRFVESQSTADGVLLFAVRLGNESSGLRWTLSPQDITNAGTRLREPPSTSLADSIFRTMTAKSTQMGDVLFVRLRRNDFQVFDTNEMLATLDLGNEKESEFREYYGATGLRERILKTSLARLVQTKPRDHLIPLLRLNGIDFFNEDLQKVNVGTADGKKVQTESLDECNFFWARETVADNGENTYRLEGAKLQAAVMVVNSQTGEVLANFAGYDPLKSAYDRSVMMKRPYGSVLKPWLYYLAFDNGVYPWDILNNSDVSFAYDDNKQPYTPHNYTSSAPYEVSVEDALIHSQNIATFNLLNAYGWAGNPSWQDRLEQFGDLLVSAGIYDVANDNISSVLGTQESTLQRIVDSYTFFSNGREIRKSYFVKNIFDQEGVLLHTHEPVTIQVPFYQGNSLRQVQEALIGVANRGTAAALRSFTRRFNKGALKDLCFDNGYSQDQLCFGGKTGTSDDGRDAWFVGFSKNFVIGVWVGYDNFQPIGGDSTGGELALPIFTEFIKNAWSTLPAIEPIGVVPTPSNTLSEFSNGVVFDSDQPLLLTLTEPSRVSCRCERVTDPLGMVIGFRLVVLNQPEFVSEVYNYRTECMQGKRDLIASGVLRCI